MNILVQKTVEGLEDTFVSEYYPTYSMGGNNIIELKKEIINGSNYSTHFVVSADSASLANVIKGDTLISASIEWKKMPTEELNGLNYSPRFTIECHPISGSFQIGSGTLELADYAATYNVDINNAFDLDYNLYTGSISVLSTPEDSSTYTTSSQYFTMDITNVINELIATSSLTGMDFSYSASNESDDYQYLNLFASSDSNRSDVYRIKLITQQTVTDPTSSLEEYDPTAVLVQNVKMESIYSKSGTNSYSIIRIYNAIRSAGWDNRFAISEYTAKFFSNLKYSVIDNKNSITVIDKLSVLYDNYSNYVKIYHNNLTIGHPYELILYAVNSSGEIIWSSNVGIFKVN